MRLKNMLAVAVIYSGLLLQACDNPEPVTGKATPIAPVAGSEISRLATVSESSRSGSNGINQEQTQFNIGNKSYLFDISNHSVDELKRLLQRAEEIGQFEADNYDQLKIVMILHGPDIDWFTEQNYAQNRQLVDLAARLDSFKIIDMKVCETTMNSRGVKREEIPAFIESVPYSPDEMKRLLQEGYINL